MHTRIRVYVVWAAGIMLFFVVVYGYFYDHKESIEFDTKWKTAMKKVGLPDGVIADISHDEDTWYYMGKNLCVGYGDDDDKCKRHEQYCAGDNKIMGTADEQALAVAHALRNGGTHPDCPLLYSGIN
jgi:hypothetical protein